MIDINKLYLVNYCHPNCEPLKNIMRLPEEEAFQLANKMAKENSGITAFYRFADFKNYYSHRLIVDDILYTSFIAQGGKPKTKHPLSFVLQGSKYLCNWFDNGIATKIMFRDIHKNHISFTYGDSAASLKRKKEIEFFTKQNLTKDLSKYVGTLDSYLSKISSKHTYIEAQLWSDEYIT